MFPPPDVIKLSEKADAINESERFLESQKFIIVQIVQIVRFFFEVPQVYVELSGHRDRYIAIEGEICTDKYGIRPNRSIYVEFGGW